MNPAHINSPSDDPAQSLDAMRFWDCWKLQSVEGRQYWEFRLPEELVGVVEEAADWEKPEARDFLFQMKRAFRFDKQQNPNSADRVYRRQATSGKALPRFEAIPPNAPLPEKALKSARRGFEYYGQLQTEEGHWPGDYGGPMFLLPGLIIVSHITQTALEAPVSALIEQYLLNHQNEDGGWGLHIEGQSTMFGTVMQYVSLRLLGLDKNERPMICARDWIQRHGGATSIPPWGKFYLSILGLYEWAGNDSLFPELWIFPRWLPMHPGRYWCHSRMVYLPMSYCYGHRISAAPSPLREQLREEIYTQSYASIPWESARSSCHKLDRHESLSPLYKSFSALTNSYEKGHIPFFRKKALDFIADYIDAEDIHTDFVNIGPVSKVLNSLCVWHRHGADSPQFKAHVVRWKDYLWLAEDGIKMNGYNGSQLWDVAFATQALAEAGLEDNYPDITRRAYHYLETTQVREDVWRPGHYFRDPSRGGWPFSTREHGWPITDCTAEGMKSALLLNESETIKSSAGSRIDRGRVEPSVDFLLAMQNANGGWASYEEIRGPAWLEKLNPAQIFGDIMIEHSYVECSSATLQGLRQFHLSYPDYRAAAVREAISKGRQFIESVQKQDGSWYGSWGICFTYGTWFGIEGLIKGGESGYGDSNPSESIRRACEFLISKQRKDGSWGESYLSCIEKSYIEHEEGQLINTAWALLGLMAANYPDREKIERGILFLLDRQENSGDWPQEGISGVFNRNCMITYSSYRNVFPLWALGRYARSCAHK